MQHQTQSEMRLIRENTRRQIAKILGIPRVSGQIYLIRRRYHLRAYPFDNSLQHHHLPLKTASAMAASTTVVKR